MGLDPRKDRNWAASARDDLQNKTKKLGAQNRDNFALDVHVCLLPSFFF